MSLRFTITIILMLPLVGLAMPAWADFRAGMDAYDRGDYATALREIRPLAEQGDANAQGLLGVLYDNGRGVPQDSVQARQWYEKSAAQGFAAAQGNLGSMYYTGEGVPQDYQQALRWLRLVADQGDALGQVKLGLMYEQGKGVPQDYVQAHKWYNLWAANGEKLGVEARDALAKQMTPTQIAEAQKLAREWKPKIP